LLTIGEGGVVSPDTAELGYQFRQPIWIDEVNFVCRSPISVAGPLGFSIRCKLNLGRIAITSTRDGGNFVPLWGFGTRQQALGIVDQAYDTNGGTTWSSFKWRLPKPLYVPAGQVLSASFFRTADGQGVGALVGISYLGRTVEPGTPLPKKAAVPFVSLYEPPAGAATAISSELDLVNPFLVPLHVQRFVMRVLETSGVQKYEDAFSGAARVITMKDSSGYDVIGDATPMLEVAFGPRRAWTFDRMLQPKERFVVGYANNSAAVVSPTISMVGWREEVMR
jgi:hypothetical protein